MTPFVAATGASLASFFKTRSASSPLSKSTALVRQPTLCFRVKACARETLQQPLGETSTKSQTQTPDQLASTKVSENGFKPHSSTTTLEQAAMEKIRPLASKAEPHGGSHLHFDVVKMIGAGSSGSVVLAKIREKQNLPTAIKILPKRRANRLERRATTGCIDMSADNDEYTDEQMRKDNMAKARIYTETRILQETTHPFITKLYCSFVSKDHLHFAMEYCAGGDLFYLLTRQQHHRFSEEVALFYAASLVLALNYLHQKGILYRDLKPENIMIHQDGFIRLTDFGLAKDHLGTQQQPQRTYSLCGSQNYVAPEVIQGDGYSFPADMYSLGCVIYEMLTDRKSVV